MDTWKSLDSFIWTNVLLLVRLLISCKTNNISWMMGRFNLIFFKAFIFNEGLHVAVDFNLDFILFQDFWTWFLSFPSHYGYASVIFLVCHQRGVAFSTDNFSLYKHKSNLISKSGNRSSIFKMIFKNLGLSPQ